MQIINALQNQSDLIRNKIVEYKIGKKVIQIKQITVGQFIAISPHLAKIQIEGEIKTPEDFHEKAIPQLEKFTEPLRAIFDELIDFNFDDLLPVDVASILLIILMQDGTKDFTNAIISVERLSRNKATDIVALQEELNSSIQ